VTPIRYHHRLCRPLTIDKTTKRSALHMQVFKDAGIDIPGFTGVPVFQAEGLTVKAESARYTPIFLSKSDLDAAVHNAHSQRVTQKVQVTQAKVDRAEHELEDATKQV